MLTFPAGELFVSFSGGRDSSLVLAHATRWQRERGLPDPVPITNRFPGDAAASEDEWQEAVVQHLGLREWIRLDNPDVDLLGPSAQRLLHAGGPFWPPNLTTLLPLAEHVGGGTVLTGLDGDGLLGGWRWARHRRRLHELRRAPWRAKRADVRLLSFAAPAVDNRVRQTHVGDWSWLTPHGRAELEREARRERREEPRTWARWLRWYPTQSYLQECMTGMSRVQGATGMRVHHPLLAAELLDALTPHQDVAVHGRTALMRLLSDGLLPESLITRRSKAAFGGPLWGERTRDFVSRWDGRLLPGDEAHVDPSLLRDEWNGRRHFGSARWLHSAYLASA